MHSKKLTTPFRWLLLFIPIATIIFFLIQRPSPPPPDLSIKTSPTPPSSLADLALPPDWSLLERFQKTISQKTFLKRLQTIYTKDHSWKKWISLDESENSASIGTFTLHFSDSDQPPPGAIFPWKSRHQLDPHRALPLSGLHIALDPGHIGGEFAQIEDREYRWKNYLIREGNLTLKTAKTLAPILRKQGAKVTLVRSELQPVTPKRASDFAHPRLFYRSSEIRARATLINQEIQPDLVICLHFNGTASQTPENSQNFHILINGTYTAGELAHEDERFQMLQRLLAGTATEEIPLAQNIADAFNDHTRLPPYQYSKTSRTSQNINKHPNLWARNLLANRLYQCPVIFMEPYIMNSHPFIKRLAENPQEIFSEYAHAVAEGIIRHYSRP